jgi:hypothetical protein
MTEVMQLSAQRFNDINNFESPSSNQDLKQAIKSVYLALLRIRRSAGEFRVFSATPMDADQVQRLDEAMVTAHQNGMKIHGDIVGLFEQKIFPAVKDNFEAFAFARKIEAEFYRFMSEVSQPKYKNTS